MIKPIVKAPAELRVPNKILKKVLKYQIFKYFKF